jgi:hypothetical protein
MIDAWLREYLRAYGAEDDPAKVVKAIFLAMFILRPQSLSQES